MTRPAGDAVRIGLGVITHAFPAQVGWWDDKIQGCDRDLTACISSDDAEPPSGLRTPVVHGPSLGVAHAKNRALAYLMREGADLLVLVEDDCRFVDMAILDMLAEAARCGVPHLMLGPITAWPHTWRYTGQKKRLGERDELLFAEYRRTRDPQDTPGVVSMVTREALLAVGGLDVRFIGRGHAHGEWTDRIARTVSSPLPSQYWNLMNADACMEFVERPASQPSPNTPQNVERNAQLRSDLMGTPPRRSRPVPNYDFLLDVSQKQPAVSVCMALMNRAKTLIPCLDTIARWFEQEPDNELVIADFGSTDCDLEYELSQRRIRHTIVELDGYFARSRGLHCAQLAASNELLLFLDADITVPANMGHVLRNHVTRGRCLFPVCWSLAENGTGKWRHTGYGMVGIHADDYDFVGGWDMRRRRWGGEDDDFHWHCTHRGLDVRRFCVTDLCHQWHPASPGFKEKYMDPDAPKREDWTPPDTRGAVQPPIGCIRVPIEHLRDSMERWPFHVETARAFVDDPDIPAEQTPYYRGVLKYKRDGGALWDEVGSGDDVDASKIVGRVERFRRLFISVRDDGYDQGQPIKVTISGGGRISLVDGHHRVACVMALGPDDIPATVKHRHPGWVRMRDLLLQEYRAEKLYTPIDHPEFHGWMVARDVDHRAAAMLRLMRPHETVIDVGCCTGGIAMALSSAGLRVTAIERRKRTLEAARMVERLYPRSSVSWQHGEAWDMDGLGRRDWVVCLSVLHHAVKTGDERRAMKWLKARGKRIVIELADGSETQMAGCNLPADQEGLGQWLKQLSGMEVRPLLEGVPVGARRSASDRRWLWVLT